MTSLAGRRAFVTGAGSGIGAATARALEQAGARVHAVGRAECDVRDPAQVDRAVDAAVRAMGGLDLVVPAAGVARFAPTHELSLDDWDETLGVNLRGTFLVFRAALPHVRRARGHLFAVASIAALRPFPASAAYCASKSAVRALAQVVAEENRRDGVRVTTLIVGAVDTPLWDKLGGTALPRERMLRADDVARAIVRAAGEPEGVSVDEVVLMPADGVL